MTGSDAVRHETFDLNSLVLTDGTGDAVLDRVAWLAGVAAAAPVTMLTLYDHKEDTLRIVGGSGLPEDFDGRTILPEEGSISRLVRQHGELMSVRDISLRPDVIRSICVQELGVRAFIGAPVHCPADLPVGALVVFSRTARIWSDQDHQAVADLATLASQRILLRASLRTISIMAR